MPIISKAGHSGEESLAMNRSHQPKQTTAAIAMMLLLLIAGAMPTWAGQDDKQPSDQKPDQKTEQKKGKNSKNDPEAIGDRDVGKGMNFYSLEKEIALGKAMAQQVEQQS